MRYAPIPSTLFIKNRQKVLDRMPQNSSAVVFSNPQMPRCGDLYYTYRQNSDFFYLTGIDQEKSIIVLSTVGTEKKAILFILRPNPDLEQWEGMKLTKEEACQLSGVNDILPLQDFDEVWTSLAKKSDVLYYSKNQNPRLKTNLQLPEDIFADELIARWPDKPVRCLSEILVACRLIKEPEEIACIERACSITQEAFFEIARNVKTGMYEYEVEAIMMSCFLRNGAQGHAFEPIIANGRNTCYLHYIKNDQKLEDGNLLSMDFGAEYANYASDCTRSLPVNGHFSKRQREVYESVLRVFLQIRSLIRPGITIAEYQKTTCGLIQEELLSLGLLTKEDIERARQTNGQPAYYTYFMHGVSHFIGLDTHDVGEKTVVLTPGMVVSCEPGIYIFQENTGIRIEDTILVTEDGNKDLLSGIPLDINDIESLMRS